MASPSPKGPQPLAQLANRLVDPVLAKRAGISTALLASWPDIVGANFADCTRPEKITWPRQANDGMDGGYLPGVLVIACEGARALFLSHAQGEVIERINAFFGFPAVRQIRIVQKPVMVQKPRRRQRPLTAAEEAKLKDLTPGLEEGPLAEAIRRFALAMANRRDRR